jgi:hypothetical protein
VGRGLGHEIADWRNKPAHCITPREWGCLDK